MQRENGKDVINNRAVTLNLIQGLPRLSWLLSLRNNVRGRSQIKFGMTPNFMGFTLIELLVVVLIIGILAAVALPKYEMAVMRSRYATLKANVNALLDAEKIYYMANGEYTDDLEALSIDLSGCILNGTKNICTYPWGYCMLDAASNSKRVHCQNTTSLQNAYAHYWDRPQFGSASCWALTTDRTDKYNKLCEKEGGSYVSTTTCTGPCVIYKLAD